MAKKPVDRAAKEKRQKIILAVGGVLLLGLVAFQGPKTMKMLNAKPPADESHAPATTTSTTDAAITAAPTGPGGIVTAAPAATATGAPTTSAAAVITPGGIGIANTTQAAAVDQGQLVSFSRFKSKDPFVQQVSPDSSSAPAATASKTATATATATPPATSAVPAPTPASTTPSQSQGNVVPVTPAAPAAKPTAAQISVDGTVESVALKASFPKASPTFTLVSLTKTTARIGIVGGSYSTGGATIALKRGKTVTLQNTADGTRYKLRLVSVS